MIIKTWSLSGNIVSKDIEWLYNSSYAVKIERPGLITPMNRYYGGLSGPAILGPTTISIETYAGEEETMLMLKFGERLCLMEMTQINQY